MPALSALSARQPGPAFITDGLQLILASFGTAAAAQAPALVSSTGPYSWDSTCCPSNPACDLLDSRFLPSARPVQELAVQGLRSNMQQVEQFMQEAVQQLQPAAGSPQRSPLEACHLVEGLSESHQAVLLPRLEAYEAACARFCQRCLDGKVQLLPAFAATL